MLLGKEFMADTIVNDHATPDSWNLLMQNWPEVIWAGETLVAPRDQGLPQ